MLEFFSKLFDTSGFPPRWHCGDWSDAHGWLHVISDGAVFGAYFAIPISLAAYVKTKQQEVAFPKLYWLFALFILSCGFTHLIEATLFWHPWYRFSGLMKAVTAVVSWATVIMLIKVMPKAMSLPGAAKLNAELSREIEERKKSELALRESSDQLNLAMDHAELGDWSWDEGQDACFFSRRAVQILGLLPDSPLTWQALRAFIQPEDRVTLPVKGLPAGLREAPVDREFRFRRPSDGQLVWIHLKGKVQWEHGGPKHAMGILQDVSARKNLDSERDRLLASESKARADAERANTVKDEFLATLSHELRTPLSAIMNWCHLLREEPGAPDQLEMGLEIIERNSKAQVQLIEDLLDMSRIVSGKVRLDVQMVDLVAVVSVALDTILPSATKKQIKVVRVLDPLAGPVRGDPGRLQQIIWNLLANAVKFTPEGGTINVALERVNSHVEITVSDTGIGISPDFLPYVFDRFLQADASTTRRHGGLGLGLSIVKNLATLHGGSVSAKSPGVGHGSTFRVQLPLPITHQSESGNGARGHPRTPIETGDVEAPDLSGLKILAVDDEPDALEALKRLLEARGAAVATAQSGPAALAALQRESFHIFVSDIGMPEMDGLDLIRKIRSQEGDARQIPAIALTAFARSDDRRRAMMAGFDSYLSKPIDVAEFFAVVARHAIRTKEAST